jgi:hypothetical protein
MQKSNLHINFNPEFDGVVDRGEIFGLQLFVWVVFGGCGWGGVFFCLSWMLGFLVVFCCRVLACAFSSIPLSG